MADKKVLVYINLSGQDYFVGTLWSHFTRGKESSEFEYSKEWLNNNISFSLEPGLFLGSGKQVNIRKNPLFGSWEYVIVLGPVFFAASFLYCSREENRKNRIVKRIIGITALCAGFYDLIHVIVIEYFRPNEGMYFLKELYDFLPEVLNLCSLLSVIAIIFLIYSFFRKEKLSNFAVSVIFLTFFCAFVRLLFTLNVSLVPMWEGHLRSVVFWFIPLVFLGIYIFDLLKKEYNPEKIRNYIVIAVMCGIFQTLWQCVNTYYWDINVQYLKNEIQKENAPLYIADEHDEISGFFNPELRRYIWWGNYALMSILLSDTYEIKTLLVNYNNQSDEGNKTFRENLYVIPEENLISIPYGVIVPIKNKYWDMTECAKALEEYNKKNKIKTYRDDNE